MNAEDLLRAHREGLLTRDELLARLLHALTPPSLWPSLEALGGIGAEREFLQWLEGAVAGEPITFGGVPTPLSEAALAAWRLWQETEQTASLIEQMRGAVPGWRAFESLRDQSLDEGVHAPPRVAA